MEQLAKYTLIRVDSRATRTPTQRTTRALKPSAGISELVRSVTSSQIDNWQRQSIGGNY